MVVILTPRKRFSQFPMDLEYSQKVAKIVDFFLKTITQTPKIVDYVARPERKDQENTAAGKALFQFDPEHENVPGEFGDLVCNVEKIAKARVWIEDRPKWVWEQEWQPNAEQIIPANQFVTIDNRKGKRAVSTAACSLKAGRAPSTLVTLFSMTQQFSTSIQASGSDSLLLNLTAPMTPRSGAGGVIISSTGAGPSTNVVSASESTSPTSITPGTSMSTSAFANQMTTNILPYLSSRNTEVTVSAALSSIQTLSAALSLSSSKSGTTTLAQTTQKPSASPKPSFTTMDEVTDSIQTSSVQSCLVASSSSIYSSLSSYLSSSPIGSVATTSLDVASATPSALLPTTTIPPATTAPPTTSLFLGTLNFPNDPCVSQYVDLVGTCTQP